ncbi:head-tail connector protein [Ruegeria sp. 2012CJ41-6]|uniref:Head-tail connector protein n=1 Tax=Ruegeria spongiae TaxID=2942209 RepID=A0ABT0Q1R6_9RHOB|nr:head-tail connector protein [Ruegeria spongiae]MCL6283108.1 head-tail connector protein [Ruegeria spongiae]
MMLTEETSIPDAALPVDQFKAHLRLGTGFAEGDLQDGVLRGFLRAAIAAIETRTGKVLITRSFSLVLNRWRDPSGEVLPVAPVTELRSVVLVNASGDESILSAESYRLEKDSQRPRMIAAGGAMPMIVQGGSARIALTAGMAADWGGLPADLGQAVLLLAAHYYEYRQETALGDGCMPFGVTSLIQRYCRMRLGLGAGQ